MCSNFVCHNLFLLIRMCNYMYMTWKYLGIGVSWSGLRYGGESIQLLTWKMDVKKSHKLNNCFEISSCIISFGLKITSQWLSAQTVILSSNKNRSYLLSSHHLFAKRKYSVERGRHKYINWYPFLNFLFNLTTLLLSWNFLGFLKSIVEGKVLESL